jgi:hypothetical protein
MPACAASPGNYIMCIYIYIHTHTHTHDCAWHVFFMCVSCIPSHKRISNQIIVHLTSHMHACRSILILHTCTRCLCVFRCSQTRHSICKHTHVQIPMPRRVWLSKTTYIHVLNPHVSNIFCTLHLACIHYVCTHDMICISSCTRDRSWKN